MPTVHKMHEMKELSCFEVNNVIIKKMVELI